jgi:hypothetical protein
MGLTSSRTAKKPQSEKVSDNPVEIRILQSYFVAPTANDPAVVQLYFHNA